MYGYDKPRRENRGRYVMSLVEYEDTSKYLSKRFAQKDLQQHRISKEYREMRKNLDAAIKKREEAHRNHQHPIDILKKVRERFDGRKGDAIPEKTGKHHERKSTSVFPIAAISWNYKKSKCADRGGLLDPRGHRGTGRDQSGNTAS
ncbi:hypothetical protein PG995_009685 [Apiospora arundinis]